MLRQEELAVINAISSIELSPVFLWELRKAVEAGKKKKALAEIKTSITSASALERLSGAGGEARTSRDFPPLQVSTRKAKEFSSSDCHLPEPGNLFVDGSEAQGTTGELASQSSRQLGPT
jgi:hypothetical protein